MAYTKLDCGITESTIWQAPDPTRLVWIAMLAKADQHGFVGASIPGLAALVRVSLEACVEAVAYLEAPDKWSRTKDHDGRRIAPADGGWVLLNHAKYRAKQNADDRRERSRLAMASLRESRKILLTVGDVNKSCKMLSQAEAEAEELKTKGGEIARVGASGTVDNFSPALFDEKFATQGHNKTEAGEVCAALKAAGINDCNPGSYLLRRLLTAGVEREIFVATAQDLVAKGKGRFALVIKTVEGRWNDANTAAPIAAKAQEDPWETAGGVKKMAARLGCQPWDEIRPWPEFKALVKAAYEKSNEETA